MENKSRELSPKVKELIKDESKKIIDENMEYIRENLIEILEKNSLALKENQKKSFSEDREEMTDLILKKYISLKNQLKVLEKTLFSSDEKEEGKENILENLMESSFIEKTTYYEEAKKNYDEKLLIFKFIEESIDSYINELKKQIEYYEQDGLKKQEIKKYDDKVDLFKRQIYILEKHYKEGQPVKLIKINIGYENERRFSYDRKKLLQGMSAYFTNFFAIISLFI